MALTIAPLMPAVAGPQFKVLWDFRGAPSDGATPLAGLLLGSGGVLYGTTSVGGNGPACGPTYCGTVYQLTPPASASSPWTESVLYNFTGMDDGAKPKSDLVSDTNGTLYGTAEFAGQFSYGVAFALAPPHTSGNWTETVLYPFGRLDDDGTLPVAGLIPGPAGSYYGTTSSGGVPGLNNTQTGYGTVYQLQPPATPGALWKHVKLFTFKTCCFTAPGSTPAPGVLLSLPDGSLLDATHDGGTANGGVAYNLLPPAAGHTTWKEVIAHTFKVVELDELPNGALVAGGNGVYYGTSGGLEPYAGAPCHDTCGSVYQLQAPSGADNHWGYKVIYAFKGDTDGAVPMAGVIVGPGGVLYGTTFLGGYVAPGVAPCFNVGCGTVFELLPPTGVSTHWTEKVLHRFVGTDGQNPEARLAIDLTGTLYGTASAGGSGGDGTAFKLVP
jgi:hypothetical protein